MLSLFPLFLPTILESKKYLPNNFSYLIISLTRSSNFNSSLLNLPIKKFICLHFSNKLVLFILFSIVIRYIYFYSIAKVPITRVPIASFYFSPSQILIILILLFFGKTSVDFESFDTVIMLSIFSLFCNT